jgi:hypothetical protein
VHTTEMDIVSHKYPWRRSSIALKLQLTFVIEYNGSQRRRYRVFLISDLTTEQQVKFKVHGPIFSLPLPLPWKLAHTSC